MIFKYTLKHNVSSGISSALRLASLQTDIRNEMSFGGHYLWGYSSVE